MSDALLAERLEHVLDAREALGGREWASALALRAVQRGPVRHPAAYRMLFGLGVLSGSKDIWWVVLLGLITLRPFRRWVLDSGEARTYFLECEALDLLDECKRRVAGRSET